VALPGGEQEGLDAGLFPPTDRAVVGSAIPIDACGDAVGDELVPSSLLLLGGLERHVGDRSGMGLAHACDYCRG